MVLALLWWLALSLGAACGARVGEALTCYGKELPVVGASMQVKLQHPVGACVAYLAVCPDGPKLAVALATRANHKLPYAVCGVCFPARVLQCETLVVVVVAVKDNICVVLVERVPYRC